MIQYISRSIILLLFCTSTALAQNNITLEDIWQKGTFSMKQVPGFTFMNDGKHYTTLEENQIKQYDFTTGQLIGNIADFRAAISAGTIKGNIEEYTFSADEKQVLIYTESEQIYRHSSKGFYYLYHIKDNNITPLYTSAKQSNASFNPQGTRVAFTSDNNLYYKDIATGIVVQATLDGERNAIINGMCDWVYEEEFSFTRAYEWSSDGSHIAFIRFDEREVPEFTMQLFTNGMYPKNETFKYPKVGEKNAKTQVFIYELASNKADSIHIGDDTDIYIPRIKWTNDASKLCIFKMNRHQNELNLLLADAKTHTTSLLMKETNAAYLDIHDNLTFLKNGKQYLWTSEQDGFNHIYLYNMDGSPAKQLTKGNFDVTGCFGVDEVRGLVYYQAAAKMPMYRELYAVSLSTGKTQTLQDKKGVNNAQFSSTFDYYVHTHTSINTPAVYSVFDNAGKLIRVIEDNATLLKKQQQYGALPVEYIQVPVAEYVQLNAWIIRPPNFDATKKYPVFMTQYSGPGSQQVIDNWGGANYWWYQMLAQQGYIVVCADPRGTGGRGEAFKKITYQQLGHYETLDQIAVARYLANQSYVDASRIGIFGWSYGGFMSSLCLFKGNDVFKTAIAVAPVSSWRWYDSIYTERFMRNEQENPKGYQENSPINFANQLKGNYLIVHGMADDNVHFQNAAEMINALVAANKQFDSFYYPNRNHSIRGGNTRLHLYKMMTDYLKEKL